MGTTAEKLQAILDAKTAIKTVINQNSANKVGDDLSTYATAVSGIRSSLVNFIQGGSNIIITAEDLRGATAIRDYMFSDCTGLISIFVPDSVVTIGDYAFDGCTELTSVTIDNGITSIGVRAFNRCSGLTSIIIPDSVTSIGQQAFNGCTELTSVTIDNGITTIGDDAFFSCNKLTAVYITDIAKWCGIVFEEFASNPLYYAHNLYLNDSLLTELVIPDTITIIKSYSFYGCSSLTSIVIPDSVMSIGVRTFAYCSGLTSITLTALTPPQLGSGVFNSTNNCPIYVPAESVDAYKSATGWSEYASRIQAIPT